MKTIKERRRIDYEMKIFNRPLFHCDPENPEGMLFWTGIRKRLNIPWWKFWVDETLLLDKLEK
jgi:hypothetical protein